MSFLRRHPRTGHSRAGHSNAGHSRAGRRRIGLFGRPGRSAIVASCDAELAVIADHFISSAMES